MSIWLRTDEHDQAVHSLEMVRSELSKVNENIYSWKWVIIALHNSLQGYMVLALRGADGLNVLTAKSALAWIKAYQQEGKGTPKLRLDTLINLYNKIQSRTFILYETSKAYIPTGTQKQSVKRLNNFRNEFIHFLPQGWSLDVSGLPKIVEDCLNIISFLVFDSGNIVWNDEDLQKTTELLIRESRNELNRIKINYKFAHQD